MVQLIIPDGVKLLKRRHPVGTSLVWSVILTGALITCSLLIFLALRGFDCHQATHVWQTHPKLVGSSRHPAEVGKERSQAEYR
jgi:hypothetical protein